MARHHRVRAPAGRPRPEDRPRTGAPEVPRRRQGAIVKRRNVLKSIAAAGLAGIALPREEKAQQAVERAVRGTPSPKIKDIQVIETAPAGSRLTVVKIITDQDGLYGYGCGTFTQRADLVVLAVEKYLKPFLIGKPADRIEDIWNASYNSSYWRNGPV